jgi:hypothetical protein
VKSRDFDTVNDTKFGFIGDVASKRPDGRAVQGQISLEQDPSSQITCRLGDNSCARAHASSLSAPEKNQNQVRDSQSLLNLQRHYGNQFVQRVLAISKKEEASSDVSPDVESAIQQSRGGGRALDNGVKTQMESAFNADFGGVRVHTDSQSDNLNKSLSSRAFTTGQDLFFKQGEYSPGSSAGRELLAHELTHVVQQNGNDVSRKLSVGAPGDIYEQEADRVARAVMTSEHQPVRKGSEEESLQRQFNEDEDEKENVMTKADNATVQRQEEEEQEM